MRFEILGDYLGREVGVKLEASCSRPYSARMGHHVGTKLETELGMRPERRLNDPAREARELAVTPEEYARGH
jgi:hypothetical protein